MDAFAKKIKTRDEKKAKFEEETQNYENVTSIYSDQIWDGQEDFDPSGYSEKQIPYAEATHNRTQAKEHKEFNKTRDSALSKALKSYTSAKLKYEEAESELDDIKSKMSLVHIYFKELGMVQYTRDQLYSIMDVIGMCFIGCLLLN